MLNSHTANQIMSLWKDISDAKILYQFKKRLGSPCEKEKGAINTMNGHFVPEILILQKLSLHTLSSL